MMMLAQGVGGLVKGASAYFGGKGQVADELARARQAQEQADVLIEAGEKGRSEFGLAPSYTQLKQMINQDPTADYLRRKAEQTEASQLDALKYGGARSILGGTQQVSQGTMDAFSKIGADEFARKMQGLNIIGGAEARVAEQKLADARGDLAFGRNLGAEALSQQYGAEDAKRMLNQQLISSGVDAAGSLAMAGMAKKNAGSDAWNSFDWSLLFPRQSGE